MYTTGVGGSANTGFEPSDFFRSFVGTARAVILEPTRFFRDLDPRGPSGGAVLFAVVCIVANQILIQLVTPLNPLLPDATYPWSWWGWIVALALSPLLAWIGLYLVAAFQHLFVVISVRQRKGFDETLRVNAYASALALLSWVPIVGYLASAYGLYVTMLGIRELHETTTARALLAILVPALIFLASILWGYWP